MLIEGSDAGFLRAALADVIVEGPAELGFAVRPAEKGSALHLVLDRSGFVLGRCRSAEEAHAVLLRHLTVFLPPPPDTVRFRLRTLVGDGGSTVAAAFPLFTDPPIIERRLAKSGFRMVDRLVIDVDDNGLIQPSGDRWSEQTALTEVTGHAEPATTAQSIDRVMVPTTVSPTRAMVVQLLASSASPTTPIARRVDIATTLTSGGYLAVGPNDRSARYDALAEISN